jgi:hypothetical protein
VYSALRAAEPDGQEVRLVVGLLVATRIGRPSLLHSSRLLQRLQHKSSAQKLAKEPLQRHPPVAEGEPVAERQFNAFVREVGAAEVTPVPGGMGRGDEQDAARPQDALTSSPSRSCAECRRVSLPSTPTT